MTTRHRVFLAHAREDKPQVRKLYNDLKARGLDPWLDEVDLMPGQMWRVEIPKAIRQAKVFLACLSSRSVGKVGYVQNEFRLALSAFGERPPGSIYLIPVRLDDCAVPDLQIPDRGLSLQDIQWVDLWQEGGFERLVAAIEHALGFALSATGFREEAAIAIPAVAQVSERPAEPETLPEGTVFRDFEAPWCPEMVVIPPGEFLMGSPESEVDREGAEGPQHPVKIGYPLAVGRYPLTFEE